MINNTISRGSKLFRASTVGTSIVQLSSDNLAFQQKTPPVGPTQYSPIQQLGEQCQTLQLYTPPSSSTALQTTGKQCIKTAKGHPSFMSLFHSLRPFLFSLAPFSLQSSVFSLSSCIDKKVQKEVKGHLLTLASSLIFQIISSMQAQASSLESCPSTVVLWTKLWTC